MSDERCEKCGGEDIRHEYGDLLSGALTRAFDDFLESVYAAALEGAAAATAGGAAPEAAAAEPQWWERAYPGGPMVGPPLVRALYFPGNPSGQPASVDGPDVLAVKRGLWRGGRWQGPASRFDDTYSRSFALGSSGNVVDSGLAGFQRQMRIQATGQMGEHTYNALRSARIPDGLPNAGEPLLDATAIDLLERASEPQLDAGDVRAAIADYCHRCIANEPDWHYAQERPIATLGRTPEAGGTTDCSGHSTSAYYWAGAPDPNGRGYDGYGYTGTLIDNPRVSSPYKIGDLAIYGPSSSSTEHVTTCYLAGDAASSRWCSHGSEAAPYAVELHYRGDLLCVVRPELVP